ncbi:MAG: 6-phosphogluconolactonase [Elusimicrobia bacterium GWB2_63_22]|nr:MAG: 6-phosphogluconolactonase [Elusimicrobia bacterium GWB2_63_22]
MAAFAAALFARALRGKQAPPLLAALPGGSTPLHFFRRLAAMRLPWEKAVFFMSDERLVPASSKHSNFGSARRSLFSKIKISRANLRPLRPGPGAAAAYENELKAAAGPGGRLDLVFLGLGADGHTASLFPGSPALASRGLVAAAAAPAGAAPARRVTLTLKALNRAATVVLLAAGPAKKAAFLKAAAGDKNIPAGRLRPRGDLYLLFSEKS